MHKNIQLPQNGGLLSNRFPISDTTFQSVDYMHSYSYKIMFRKDSPRKDGSYPIILSAVLDGKPVRVPLKLYGTVDTFDEAKGLFIMTKGNAQQNALANSYNGLINLARVKADKIFNMYRFMERALTVDLFKQEMNKGFVSNKCFYTWCDNYINNQVNAKSDGTINVYRQCLKVLKQFRPNCGFADLSTNWVADFDTWMKKQRVKSNGVLKPRFNPNTISKHHKTLKTFSIEATEQGMLFDNIYKNQQIARIESERDFLEKKQVLKLLKLYNENVLSPRRQHCLAQFLFSCFTGLRMSDAQNITDDNIVGGTLVFKPIKTAYKNKTVKIPIPTIGLTFIKDASGRFFGNWSDDTINKELKEIKRAAELSGPLYYSMSRHTFATLFLDSGGKVEVLQKLMGHSKIETTMIYVHIMKERKQADMDRFNDYFQLIAV